MKRIVLISTCLFLVSIIEIPMAHTKASQKQYSCTAYCRFHNVKTGAILRDEITKSALSSKRAWSRLKTACAKLGSGELQVKNPQFTSCADGDSQKACAAPEFSAASAVNACSVQ